MNDDDLKVLKESNEFIQDYLNYCLKYFVLEIRKTNGDKYPPRTLKEITAVVQRHFCHDLSKPWSIFTDQQFHEFRLVLDREALFFPDKYGLG